jgi:hypothetical protein
LKASSRANASGKRKRWAIECHDFFCSPVDNGAVRNALTKIDVLPSWADEPVDDEGKKVEIPAAEETLGDRVPRLFLLAGRSSDARDRVGKGAVRVGWLVEVNGAVRNALTKIDVLPSWADEPVDDEGKKVARGRTPRGRGNAGRSSATTFSARRSIQRCARPGRLTPDTYDRNVFHIEFSTEGTGLKYAIGEALGIHLEDGALLDARRVLARRDRDDRVLVEAIPREEVANLVICRSATSSSPSPRTAV